MTQTGDGEAGAAPKRRKGLDLWAGIALASVGLLLLAGAGAYYGYTSFLHSQLDDLNFPAADSNSPPLTATQTTASVVSMPAPGEPDQVLRQEPSSTPLPLSSASALAEAQADANFAAAPTDVPEAVAASAATAEAQPAVALEPSNATGPAFPSEADSAGVLVAGYASVYPGAQIHPMFWDSPLWAGTDPYAYNRDDFPDGYLRLPASYVPPLAGVAARAQRIRIPVIGVDSAVAELQIVDLGDSRSYETPKHVVGHIPGTANPGEAGAGWLFGHLESPIRGEGDVFRRLPKIPEHLKNGDPVYVSIASEDGEYLYQVVSTRVVPQEELGLYDSDGATIILVSCVPRLVYDHRLLVTAKLVGIKSA